MPSLRRALSSQSVRSSPYPPVMGPLGSHRRRRSTGKETASRRVLADLEWWTVVDGQRDVDLEQANDDRDRDYFPFTLDGIGRPSTPVLGHSENARLSTSPQTPTTPIPFPVLPIVPHTPTRDDRSLDWSSLESTPESIVLPRPCIAFADLDLDIKFFSALPTFPRKKRVPSITSSHRFVFADFISSQPNVAEPYGSFADLSASPLSRHIKLLD